MIVSIEVMRAGAITAIQIRLFGIRVFDYECLDTKGEPTRSEPK